MSNQPVVHFEMSYEDAKRVSEFYKNAFGWGMRLSPEMGDYVTAQTADTDENNMVKTPGTINGGFYPRKASVPAEPSVVIAVTDLEAAMAAVTKAGGKVLGEPVDIPGVGRYVSFTDTEGNRASILQPTRSA